LQEQAKITQEKIDKMLGDECAWKHDKTREICYIKLSS